MLRIQDYSSRLKQNRHGIWVLKKASTKKTFYPDDGNDSCFSIEEKSFWFKHRNYCILNVLQSNKEKGPLFDIGGGNGFVSSFLSTNGIDCILVEPNHLGVKNAKKRKLQHIIHAPLQQIRFQKQSIPSVGLFDVLEHIHDDSMFLKIIYSVLEPRGRLYITVPAHPFLWSAQDVYAQHFRRYSLSNLSQLLIKNKFSVTFASYFFSFLPIPILMLRSIPCYFGISSEYTSETFKKDMTKSFGLFRPLVNIFLKKEIECIKNKKQILFGSSIVLSAQKI
jgi:SAM-dependent methyltransferase